jgi:ABC-2 type transport system permease protein
MNAIWILCLRQLKRYSRSRSRIIGSLGQPTLFLLALGFGLGPTFRRAGGGDYRQFLSPGVIAMAILFTSIFSGIELIWDRQFGFLKETLVAPVSRIQVVFGRALGGALVAMLQGIIVLVISMIAGFRFQSWALLPLALLFMFLISLLFTSVGTAIGSVMQDMQGFQLVMNFLVMPLFFLSSALFPVAGLGRVLGVIVHVDPLSYGVDGLRGALTQQAAFGQTTDLLVLTGLTVIMLSVGSYLFSRIQL